MTFRLLDPATEWPIIADEFTTRNVPVPNPTFDGILGAFNDEGQLAGFLVISMRFHFEPLVLYDPSALRGLLMTAANSIASKFKTSFDAYAWAGSEASREICEKFGGVPRTETAYVFHKIVN